MATGKSGYFDVSNGGFTLRINWLETYDITANTSVVSITSADLMSTAYFGYSYFPHHYIKVNGQEVATFNSTLGTHSYYIAAKNTFYGINAESGSPPPWTSSAIAHNADGTKTITIEIYINLWRTSSGAGNGTNLSGSKTIALTMIPRKSSLSVGNGILGNAQTLTVSKQASSFTHTITAKCGSASTTVCTKSSSTSISFTPPLSWARQNTTGTIVPVVYTITTYNGDTSVGSNSYTVNCGLPASVKPSVSISVSDAMGYASTYGGYIKGLSKFKIDLTETLSYGSAIASRTITANGSTYTSEPVTTGVIKSSGTLTISASVTDKRGRSRSASTTATVLNYSAPVISLLKVNRCNSDGTSNEQGEYVKVTYSGSVTSLSSKNTAKWVLYYKKSTDTSYSSTTLSSGTTFAMSNATKIIAADSGSSYDVMLTIKDRFTNTSKSVVASTAFTMMHFNAAGNGMSIGKISEHENVFDIGLKTKYRENVVLDNNKRICWENANGYERVMAYLSAGNHFYLGQDGYSNSEGSTRIYGNYVNIYSNDMINIYGNNDVSGYIQSSNVNTVNIAAGTDISTAWKSWKFGVCYRQADNITVTNAPGGKNTGYFIFYQRFPSYILAHVHANEYYYAGIASGSFSEWHLHYTNGGDVVIAKGTSGIWTYRKWASGVAECWGNYVFTPTLTNSASNAFFTNAMPVSLPFKFNTITSFLVNKMDGGYLSWASGETAPSSGNTVHFYFVQYANSNVVESRVAMYVQGTWK